MAKKGDKGASGGAHSHIRARMAYLNNAAMYLQQSQRPLKTAATQTPLVTAPQSVNTVESDAKQDKSTIQASLPRHFINQMRGIARKSQQRLSQETKRGFCRRCDIPLVPGETCTKEIQNDSKGGRKPWADVLVVCCKACQAVKRFPLNQKRSMKLSVRKSIKAAKDKDVT